MKENLIKQSVEEGVMSEEEAKKLKEEKTPSTETTDLTSDKISTSPGEDKEEVQDESNSEDDIQSKESEESAKEAKKETAEEKSNDAQSESKDKSSEHSETKDAATPVDSKEPETSSTQEQDTKDSGDPEPTMSSEKMLVLGTIALIIAFGSFFAYSALKPDPVVLTPEELHQLNLAGEEIDYESFVYKGVHSFIKIEDIWQVQLVSPTGQTLYNLAFRYSPLETEDIPLQGLFNAGGFNNATEYYITFNPEERNHSFTALAVGDMNNHLMKSFQKQPIAACDRNATSACISRPIVTCETHPEDVVIYVLEADEPKVTYDRSCITIQGNQFDLVKGVNKVLYTMYGVI